VALADEQHCVTELKIWKKNFAKKSVFALNKRKAQLFSIKKKNTAIAFRQVIAFMTSHAETYTTSFR